MFDDDTNLFCSNKKKTVIFESKFGTLKNI